MMKQTEFLVFLLSETPLKKKSSPTSQLYIESKFRQSIKWM